MFSRGFSQAVNHEKSSFSRDEFEIMNHVAKASGLSSYQLFIVCSWIESKENNEEIKLKCIECLIPEANGGTIPENVCIRLTCLLKSSIISLTTKMELLKWMICAQPFMERNGRFQMLYEVIFGLLKEIEMQPYTAHFIFLITQKKHVTSRRVKCLSKLMLEYGNLPCFDLIIRLYFLHAPEHFEDEFHDEFHDEMEYHFESLGAYPTLIKNVHQTYDLNFSADVLTTLESNSTEVLSEYAISEKASGTTSPRLSAFEHLYKQFRTLEKSTNLSNILKSSLKRLFLTSKLEKINQIKIHDYILSTLHADLDSPYIIERNLELFRLQRSIPGLVDLAEYLLSHDNCNPNIAEVACYTPISCFKKIQYKLQVMRDKFLETEDVVIKYQWLNSLSKMLCYWFLQNEKPFLCDGMCGEESDTDMTLSTPLIHIPYTEIRQLSSWLDFFCDSLIMEDCSPFTLYQVLQHYQMGVIARQLKPFSINCFPSPSVFQLSLFSLSSSILENLCGLILRINTIHDVMSQTLNNEENLILKASCNDIKKVFLGGTYKNESTYLAKTRTFKFLNERSLDFKDPFILYKHPALSFIKMKFYEKQDFESSWDNSEVRLQFFSHLKRSGSKEIIRLIFKIK